MPWKRKKKAVLDRKKLAKEGIVFNEPEDPKLLKAGITEAHVKVSEAGVQLVYWRNGEYHEADVPAVLVSSFAEIIGKNSGFFA